MNDLRKKARQQRELAIYLQRELKQILQICKCLDTLGEMPGKFLREIDQGLKTLWNFSNELLEFVIEPEESKKMLEKYVWVDGLLKLTYERAKRVKNKNPGKGFKESPSIFMDPNYFGKGIEDDEE